MLPSKLGKGPYLMSDVASEMGVATSSAKQTRSNFINGGVPVLYTLWKMHGYIEFTVPMFDDFSQKNKCGFYKINNCW